MMIELSYLGGIITLITAVIGALVTWRKGVAESKKILAEARNIDADGAQSLVEATSRFVDELREEMQIMKSQMAQQNRTIESLRSDLRRAITRVDELETERNNLRERVKTLENKLARMKEENDSLHNDNLALREVVRMLKQDVNSRNY